MGEKETHYVIAWKEIMLPKEIKQMLLTRGLIIFLFSCLCISVLALTICLVTWTIKCVLVWSDDIAYWWKELKNQHKYC